jgi:predicted nucleic acid-binding protein
MRKVICNTTPLLSLLKIQQLHLLHTFYDEVYIPEEVYEEMEEGREKAFYQDLKSIQYLKIEPLRSLEALALFPTLDKGEAAVLSLATALNADLVIIDERAGRNWAKKLSLPLTGTLGILLRAKQEGHIKAIAPFLSKLQRKGTWLNPKLVKHLLGLAGE